MADPTTDPVADAHAEAAIPAATVILVRDARGDGGVETLMLRRNSKLAFGGMWVFPGGRIDPADAAGVDPSVPGVQVDIARRAAAREALEEAALPVDPSSLVLFSRWTPPAFGAPKRFTTWIFLAAAPEGAVTIDGGEIHEHRWLGAADVLRRRDAGEIEVAPPTWVSLHRLARSASVAEALAAAEAAEFEHFQTHIGRHEGIQVCMWHGDAGYDATDASQPGRRHRLVMGEVWEYHRDL